MPTAGWRDYFAFLLNLGAACDSSTQASHLVDELLHRVRQKAPTTGAFGATEILTPDTARSFALKILSECQRIVNISRSKRQAGQAALRQDELVLTVGQAFYALSTSVPDAALVTEVRSEARSVPFARSDVLLREVGTLNRRSDRPEFWSLLGRDLLIVWPPPLTAITLIIVSAAFTDDLADGDCIELSDFDSRREVLSLAEAVMSLRWRNTARAADLVGTGSR